MKILLAYDGSNSSKAALDEAIKIAKGFGGKIIIAHAVDPSLEIYYPGFTPLGDPLIDWQLMGEKAGEEGDLVWPKNLEEYRKQVDDKAQKVIDPALEKCRGEGVEAEARIEYGTARKVICDLAEKEGVDLLVVGSRGLSPIKRLFLGSVSSYLVHHAPTNVLVVREKGEKK